MKQLVLDFIANDIVRRAVKTFIQAFVAALMATGFQFDTTTLIAAGAAGLSALWNYVRSL